MKSKFKIILWWSFLIIYLEIIYKFFIMKDLLTTNTFSVVLFSIPWIIIFTIITSIFNEKVNKILTIVFSFLIVLITLAQIVYYNFYNSMFSFLSLTTGTGQVMQFYVMIASVIARIWYIFAIILIPYILFLIFKNKLFNFKKNNLKFLISYLLIFILSFLGIILVINKNNEGFYSLKSKSIIIDDKKFIEYYRKKRNVDLIKKLLIIIFHEIEHVIQEKIMNEKLYQSISTLSPTEKYIIKSYYFDELTDQKIGDVLGVAQNTVSYRRRKVLKKLAKFLKN